MRRLWWRWSLRDLRRRWLLVATIAAIIGVGTGTYAALLGTSEWRRRSNDASFASLQLHDVQIRLALGTAVAEGTLAGVAQQIPHATAIAGLRERLVLPTQFAAPGGLLASGELVGSALGAPIDGVSRHAGRSLTAADDGLPLLVMERAFAEGNDLPVTGEVDLSGGVRATYVGLGQSPEYFILSGGQGGLPFMSQASYGVAYTTLHSAQAMTGSPGKVNDLVIRLTDPGLARTVRAELEARLSTDAPAVVADVTQRRDVGAYRILYDDIDADERLWRVLALLILLGAAFAALNLTVRVIEAMRREFGIGMALGVPDRVLAVRPLLFGIEVALIGVVVGLAVGWALGLPLRSLFTTMVPLPIWITPLQAGVFAQAALIGFLLPFAAVLWPVWRAVRVQPVEAIKVGHLAGRQRPRAGAFGRLHLPGSSWHQMPVRNLVRTPRRTLMTVLGVSAAITALVTTFGFLDTFTATLDASSDETLRVAPDRLVVSLRTFETADGPTLRSIRALPHVGSASAAVLLPVTAAPASSPDATSIDLMVQTIPADAPWVPRLSGGSLKGGIVLSRKAAHDLGVSIGHQVILRHPRITPGGLTMTRSTLRVAGLHPDPVRGNAYLPAGEDSVIVSPGLVNVVTVRPATGYAVDDVRRAVLGLQQVSAVQTARAVVDAMRSSLDEFLGVLRVAGAVTLLLALLIAFNTASIGMDERSREHATMMAFGLSARTVLAIATIEAAIIGVMGTLIGIVGGYGVLAWVTRAITPGVLPEIDVTAALSAGTVTGAMVLGVATVALAPVLTLRRLRHIDIPTTLRLVE